MKSSKGQGGFTTILYIIVLMGVISTILLGMKSDLIASVEDSSLGRNVNTANREKVFSDNLIRLQRFLDSNSNIFSATTLPAIYNEKYILSKAGIFNYGTYRFRLVVTNLQQYNNSNTGDTRNVLQGRDFYFWMAPEDKVDQTVFSAVSLNNVVSDPESVFAKISSKNIEMEKFSEAVMKMDAIGAILKNMFAGHLEADPLRDASANYFANPPCGYRPAYLSNEDTIACSGSTAGSFAPLSTLGFINNASAPTISVNPTDLKTPWGGEIEISNVDTNGASITLSGQSFKVISKSPPYTVVLRTVTPSGFSIIRTVVQPF